MLRQRDVVKSNRGQIDTVLPTASRNAREPRFRLSDSRCVSDLGFLSASLRASHQVAMDERRKSFSTRRWPLVALQARDSLSRARDRGMKATTCVRPVPEPTRTRDLAEAQGRSAESGVGTRAVERSFWRRSIRSWYCAINKITDNVAVVIHSLSKPT